MEVSKLKEYISSNSKIEYILEEIGCKHIVNRGHYIQCGNYDGDRRNAIVVYCDEMLTCENYTRDIVGNKNSSDLIDLVMYNKKLPFFKAIKYLCDILGMDYYEMQNDDDLPESLKITQMLLEMKSGDYDEDDKKPLKPINEKILTYYKPYCNVLFKEDNISYEIQKLFEVGYDDESNRITIPIRDEIGNLVGVKGRYFGDDCDNKYLYLEKCARSKILFGLDKSYKHIKESGFVYVVESEKAVMQLWNMGYRNVVSTGGKKISKKQKDKLASLGVRIVLAFDKDVAIDELQSIADSFLVGISISCIIDDKSILGEKESPSDTLEKWEILVKTEKELRVY